MSKSFKELWQSSLICKILKFIFVVDYEDFSGHPLAQINLKQMSDGERANLLLEQIKLVISIHQAISVSLITIISLYFAGYLWALNSFVQIHKKVFGLICLEAFITSIACGIIFYLDFKTKRWCKSAATALHYSPFHGSFSEIGLFIIAILITVAASVALAGCAAFNKPDILMNLPGNK